jgi:hypothetical protein
MRALLFLLISTSSVFAQSRVYIDQIGNTNNIYVSQTSGDGSSTIVLNNGDANSMTVVQDGLGRHSAFIGTPPSMTLSTPPSNFVWNNTNTNNNNSFTILQTGSANHTAAINLDPATNNSNNTASIQQAGNAPKSFVLNLSGSGIGATVLQDNLLTPDSASMSITCVAPPCGGYSYIKH